MGIYYSWDRDYYIDPADIPADKTYEDLLQGLGEGICHNNKFIEINKFHMAQIKLNDQDYEIFWKCMKLYDVYGKNYFGAYLDVLSGAFGSFFDGIEQWFHPSEEWLCHTDAAFLNLVNILHFFCFEAYQCIPISAFDEAVGNAAFMYQKNLASEEKERRAKRLPKWRKKSLTTSILIITPSPPLRSCFSILLKKKETAVLQ